MGTHVTATGLWAVTLLSERLPPVPQKRAGLEKEVRVNRVPVRVWRPEQAQHVPGALSCGFPCPEAPAVPPPPLCTAAGPGLPPADPGPGHMVPVANSVRLGPLSCCPCSQVVFQKLHFDDLQCIFMENT